MKYETVKPVRVATRKYKIISQIKKPIANYIDRPNLRKKVNAFFPSTSNFVFICGMGGCGKTEFIKKYVESSSEYYKDTVCMLDYQISIKDTINNGIRFETDYDDSQEVEDYFVNFEKTTGEEVFSQKIKKINECEKMLIVIDNYQQEIINHKNGKDYLSELLNSNADVIILSREIIDGFENNCIDIEDCLTVEEEVDIFRNYCSLSNINKETIVSLCEICHHHILSIVLLAKLVSENSDNLNRIYEAFSSNKKREFDNSVIIEKDRSVFIDTVMEHLGSIIELFDLDNDHKALCKIVALATPYSFSREELCDFFGFDLGHLEQLVWKKLITTEDEYIYIHPLIAEIILYKLDIQKKDINLIMDYYVKNESIINEYYIGELVQKLSLTNIEISLEKYTKLLNTGAYWLFNQGRYDSTQEAYSYIYRYSCNGYERFNALYFYALCLKHMDKCEEGIQLYEELIKECENDSDRKIIKLVVQSYIGIANDYYEITKRPSSEDICIEINKAISIYKKALKIEKTTFGNKTKRTAAIYGNLALMYSSICSDQKAISNFKKAIALNKEICGENSYDVAIDYNNLGDFYSDRGMYEAAETAYIYADLIKDIALPRRHKSKIETWKNLSNNYINMCQFKEAEKWLNKAEADATLLLDKTHPLWEEIRKVKKRLSKKQ